jgi:hypothetical protein
MLFFLQSGSWAQGRRKLCKTCVGNVPDVRRVCAKTVHDLCRKCATDVQASIALVSDTHIVRDFAVTGESILLIEPAAKVYIGAAFRAEGTKFLDSFFAAFGAF